MSAIDSGEVFNVSHLTKPDRLLLARVVGSWASLSSPLKLAILSIVEADRVAGAATPTTPLPVSAPTLSPGEVSEEGINNKTETKP